MTQPYRDYSCIFSLVMFYLANAFNTVELSRELRHNERSDQADWYALDPNQIQHRWALRVERRDLRTAGLFFNALAWFSLIIPVLQIATVLSRHGRRKIGLHVVMVALVCSTSFTELLCRLFTIGMDHTQDWIANDFQLSDWGLENGRVGTGWKVAEVFHLMSQGIMLWVDAFEWLALGGIMLLIFYSFSTETSKTAYSFPRRWGTLSFFIAVLSLVTFAINVMKLNDHPTYAPLHITVTAINAFLLYPVWFLSLSTALPEALADREAQEQENDRAEELQVMGAGNSGEEGGGGGGGLTVGISTQEML